MARVEKAAGPAATAGRSKATGSAKGPSKAAPAASVKGTPRATATLTGPGTRRDKAADKPVNAKAAGATPKPVAAAGKRSSDRAVVAAAATRSAPKSAPAKPAPKASSARAEAKAQPKPKAEAKPAPKPTPKAEAKPKVAPPAARPTDKGAVAPVTTKGTERPATKGGPARANDGAKAAAGPVKKAPTRSRSEPLDKFLAEQRQLLFEERATHLMQAESLKEEADALAAEMEPGESEFGEEGGEGGNLSIERELDLVLSAQAKAAVEEIERALAKIESGTYGLCEKCGREIPKARLRVLPHAPLCVACKSGGLSRR
jgi:DnaK suppressor protein